MKKSIFALISVVLMVYLSLSMSYAATVTSATRTVPEFVDPDTEFDVTVNVEAGEGSLSYILYERVDDGLTLVSSNPQYFAFNEENRKIMWVIMDEKTITYRLRSSVPGTYVFNGNVIAGNDTLSVEGDISVKVRDNCTENWTCGYWSECLDGEQTRECQDENQCLFPVSIPPMAEECSEEVPPPEDEEAVTPPANTGGSSSGGGGTVTIITNITTDDDEQNQTVNNTENDESPGNVTAPGEVKENKTDPEKITGLVTSGDSNKSGGQGSAVTEIPGDSTKSEDKPAESSKMPLLTKALISIMIVAVIIAAIRSR
ncbi:MAG: hypothetical protein ABIG84_00335 [archaeon]